MEQTNSSFDIYGNKDIISNKTPICLTLGNFDGVHLGHKYLIDSMKQKNKNIPLVVVTFDPHTSHFFSPNNPKHLLTSLEDKISLLLSCGVSTVIVQKFNHEFSQLSADDFCDKWIKNKFNIHSIVLGYDFCYGKNKQGNYDHLKLFGEKHGWDISKVVPFEKENSENIPISSSFIRQEILLGHMENAKKLLGHPYFLSGVVTRGDQRGRTIGFPTANLKLDSIYVIPKYGVYSCYVEIESDKYKNKLPAVMNCGIRPSVGKDLKLQIEAFILDFSDDIYDMKVKFYPQKYIRGEQKFSGLLELKTQINLDVELTKEYFSPK